MHLSENGEFKVVLLALFITSIFVVLASLPFLLDVDMMEWGFGISCILFFFSIMGLVTALVYFLRALELEKILSGKEVIARWNYSKEELLKFAELDFKEEKEEKKGLFFIVLGFSILFSAIFLLIDFEPGLIVAAALLALNLLILFLIFAVPRYNYWRNKNSKGQVIVAKNGVLINNAFHEWGSFGTSFESINYREKERILEICYSTLARHGRDYNTIRIMVPKKEDANKILDAFR